MLHRFLSETRFYDFLLTVDRDLAEEARGECCGCGGRLHCADYPRKPRGGPADLSQEHNQRFSFCCARHGCRQRRTPPSVRFLGRKVYFGAVVVIVTAMLHGPNSRRVTELQRILGAGWHTIDRWRRWWLDVFAESPFWRAVRGHFAVPVDMGRLPYSLWARFGGDAEQRLVSTLRLLSPMSTNAPSVIAPG